MGTVSIETSRAIYDDALTAYGDQSHSCHGFIDFQPISGAGDDPTWELPIPFLGAQADRGLVFLGVNPSYWKGEPDPRLGAPFESWDRWARGYFDNTPSPWARLYSCYQAIGEAVFGSDFRLGRDAMVLECVRFRSAAGEGTRGASSKAVWEHELPTTRQLLLEIAPEVVVSVGKDPLWALSTMCENFSPTLPTPFRLTDYEFKSFGGELGGARIKVVPSHHLTAVWGDSKVQLAKVAEAIRATRA
jgi:hypothetical protein